MLEFGTILAIAISLAMDALAVSVSVGMILGRASRRQAFRIYFHFGLFQALFPVLGWMLGTVVSRHLLSWNRIIAFLLLALIGARMIREGLAPGEPEPGIARQDPTRGWTMVGLSTGVSIDALAVGISFSLLGVSIAWPAVVIGLVTGTLSFAGIRFGSRIGNRFGSRVAIVGGVILLLIGGKILLLG